MNICGICSSVDYIFLSFVTEEYITVILFGTEEDKKNQGMTPFSVVIVNCEPL
jgi:tRNA(Ile)-lysidine synthase TilS/MesJ